MTVKLDREIRRVVVLGGNSPKRRIYEPDRDTDRDDDGIKVTVIHRDQYGRLVAREQYDSDGERRRKKQSKLLRPIERTLRRAIKFEVRLLNNYLGRHERSSTKKRNGWIKDLPGNLMRSIRKSKPRTIFRNHD